MSLASSKWSLFLLAGVALVCQDAQALQFQVSPAPSTSANQEAPDNGATWFGSSIESVGDLDHDGHDDLVVAAPMAWSANGRTGQVLILSGTDGKILRELHGDTDGQRFGWSLSAIRPTLHSSPTHLAVTILKIENRKAVFEIKIISLLDGQVLATIPEALGFSGSPGDLDGDRRLDYAVHFPDPTIWTPGFTRWYSGKTWEAIDRQVVAGPIRLLDEDYDGDGIHDYLFRERSETSSIQVCSGATGGVITSLKFTAGRDPRDWESAVCIARKVDGKRAIVISNPDRERGMAALSAFSGVTGKLELETSFGKWSSMESDEYTFSLREGSAQNEFYAIRTPPLAGELQAYSGMTLELLWRAPLVVERGSSPLALLRAKRPPSNALEVEVAVGKLRIEEGGWAEPDGEVGILSATTGKTLRWFRERDYPSLTRDHYSEPQPAEKK